MTLYRLKGLVAYYVLDFAGVLLGGVGGNSELYEHIRQHTVPLVNLFGFFPALIGKGYMTGRVNFNISAVL